MTPHERQFIELPASAAQRGLWLIEQLGEPSATYTMHPAVRVEGPFDPGVARRAFEELVRRHETLRTSFSWRDGELTQLVEDLGPGDPVTLDFEVLDTASDDLVARAEELAGVPFDVLRGPLVRVRILRSGAHEHLVLVVVHHMVFDGWSEGVLWREFAALYDAAAAGRDAGLPELPLQYADFADWQRQRLDGGVQAELAAYWRDRLADAGVLELPTDRARPAVQGHRGLEHRFTVPADVTAALREFARAEHTTLFSVVYAAYHALLVRYARRDDLCVGVPFGNRALPQLEGVIGLFVNHAVFRVDSGDDPAFRDLVARVRAQVLDAVDRVELPFSRLVEELAPERDLSRNPLFQTVFSLEERPTDGVALDGARLTHVDLHLGISKFDVALVLFDEGEAGGEGVGLSGFLEYDADLFDPPVMAALAEQYVHLLKAAAREPGTRLSALDPVPPDERRRHLTLWNDTARDFPRRATTAELFAEQVRAAPDAPAVLTADGTLTYRALDERADRLARRLRALGVGPETPVGICLERSVDLLVAVLATLKAQGAYLPLTRSHPADRLVFCVRDAGARVVLTAAHLAERFADVAVPVVRVDADEPETPDAEPAEPLPTGDAENLAYIIYTSGSTGVPKGIGVSHRALARLVKGADYAELGPGEVHLQLSPLSFDASLLEVWGPLLNGGAVALPQPDLPFPDVLRDALKRYPVTTLLLISPQLHVAADEFPDELSGVRQLLVGGDVLSPRHAHRLLPYLDGDRFVHVYGPTECTLFATARQLTAVDPARATVPIGTPIANTRAYVMDESFRLVPVGAPGELWLGGDGLARGYHGRPALTAEHFVPDPFGPHGGRLYRTGDLVRRLPDGGIEFVGRIDGQVKVRGYRIETGEVETVLTSHPGVREAAVTVRDDAPGGRALVAHLVPDDGPSASDDDLRALLRGALPEYMVPAAFVRLDTMPLTVNGKVDRARLPAPRYGEPEGDAGAGTVGPTSTEGVVRDIWHEVLGVPGVARDVRFFDVGGNSLLLAALFDRIHQLFPAADLSLVDLFEHTTIADIAAEIERRAPTGTEAEPSLDL
ncbi:amino acid adenylation domain-containing protein [Streptomyces sp. NPDC059063]|uniref:non-ribosomal peptide synthetase n=1 Tax=unclassified Streptomyces TaxID=2593676 RepID=UPI0036AC7D2C